MPRIVTEADLPPAIQARRAKERAQQAERKKDPKTLTDKERLTRIETILDIGGG